MAAAAAGLVTGAWRLLAGDGGVATPAADSPSEKSAEQSLDTKTASMVSEANAAGSSAVAAGSRCNGSSLAAAAGVSSSAAAPKRRASRWYIDRSDLEFFKSRAADEAGWELMYHRDVPNEVYSAAWRRSLPRGGGTEYKTVTICGDASAEEFTEFYLDDEWRLRWEDYLVMSEVLEAGDPEQREQVVRWTRQFPKFMFLSDREYTFARRVFVEEAQYFSDLAAPAAAANGTAAVAADSGANGVTGSSSSCSGSASEGSMSRSSSAGNGSAAGSYSPSMLMITPSLRALSASSASASASSLPAPAAAAGTSSAARPHHHHQLSRPPLFLYGITKAVSDHPAPRWSDIVTVDTYYSMWRAADVPCPWGSSRPACETVLIHSEQMKIPERMARAAVSWGMDRFVKNLTGSVRKFILARRAAGVSPWERDPHEFCRRQGLGEVPGSHGRHHYKLHRPGPGKQQPPNKSQQQASTTAVAETGLQQATEAEGGGGGGSTAVSKDHANQKQQRRHGGAAGAAAASWGGSTPHEVPSHPIATPREGGPTFSALAATAAPEGPIEDDEGVTVHQQAPYTTEAIVAEPAVADSGSGGLSRAMASGSSVDAFADIAAAAPDTITSNSPKQPAVAGSDITAAEVAATGASLRRVFAAMVAEVAAAGLQCMPRDAGNGDNFHKEAPGASLQKTRPHLTGTAASANRSSGSSGSDTARMPGVIGHGGATTPLPQQHVPFTGVIASLLKQQQQQQQQQQQTAGAGSAASMASQQPPAVHPVDVTSTDELNQSSGGGERRRRQTLTQSRGPPSGDGGASGIMISPLSAGAPSAAGVVPSVGAGRTDKPRLQHQRQRRWQMCKNAAAAMLAGTVLFLIVSGRQR